MQTGVNECSYIHHKPRKLSWGTIISPYIGRGTQSGPCHHVWIAYSTYLLANDLDATKALYPITPEHSEIG